MKNKLIFFYLGLAIFYLVIFLSPFKPVYFAAYLVATFFFYLYSKDIQLSLFYSLILSLFSDVGLAGSWFLNEPRGLNIGSGYSISPLTILVLFLSVLSVKTKINNLKIADVFVLLFFIWCIVSLFLFPYSNVLFSVMNLGEIILSYYLMRTYINKNNLRDISYILISMLMFQSVVAGFQFMFGRPIGVIAEAVTSARVFGFTAAENESLFRLTGTFFHPNFFASFLLVIIPFLFLIPSQSLVTNAFRILSLLVLFFTYTRSAWIIIIFIMFFIALVKKIKLKFPRVIPYHYFIFSIIITLLFIYITPYLSSRLDTFSQSFEEGGSIDVRFKLMEEGINLLSQYPITGVGLNRSVQEYSSNPVTSFFQNTYQNRFYRIHSTPLEISAELGIMGILLFSLFIYFVIKKYFFLKYMMVKKAAFLGLLGLIGMSLLNPFFHMTPFRFFFLLAAIILA